MSKPVLRIDDQPIGLTHKDCGGEVHSVEAVYIIYEIVSDGADGFEYTGNRLDTVPMEGMNHEFECRRCGMTTDHWKAEIIGSEVVL